MDKVNVYDKLSMFSDHWSPKIVGELNEMHIKLAKMQGEFVWHTHAQEDELFYLLKGQLTIRLRDRDINLCEGEFFIVPRGVEHMPYAAAEAQVMLIERKTTLNTGDLINERTVAQPQTL